MKQLFLVLFILQVSFAGAQTLVSGNYTSSDGNYTVNTSQEGNEITLTEPNRVNLYKSNGNNIYYHTEPKYAEYYIKVTGNKEYYTGKKSSTQEYLFTFSGTGATLSSGTDDCPLYNKYSELLANDEANTQAWTFCAAAAIALCTYNGEGGDEYVKSVVIALKSMMDTGASCPCEDVISRSIWNSVD
jgi:hypothetical protein